MASLPLLPPDCDDPKLVGIARLAAAGEHIRDGHNIEYFTIQTRSILNRCNVPRMPFSWTVNPFRGCEFACKYCYARYTHEFMELRDPLAFERLIYVKQDVVSQLRRDLKKVKDGEQIAIGTATDPYQPAERRYEVTRSILEEFSRHEGLDISIVTKSNLVVRDTDLLRKIAERNRMYVNLTVTTLDYRLAHILEPRAPRPDLRLEAVRALTQAGVSAGVICAPVLPDINDSLRDLDALVKATKEHGGLYIYANPLFLKPCSANVFLPFLEKEFPHLVEKYRARYGEKAFVTAAYRKRISTLMTSLRKKYGLYGRWDYASHPKPASARASQAAQMGLFPA
ncbi:MAG TPA: radical SAM protein [Terriglobales bacterium]|nr:radical SAM protein [Terriglobales bacterium]